MSVDLGANMFYSAGAAVQLTPAEAELAHLLVESYPRTVSHHRMIWGLYGDMDENFRDPMCTIRVHVSRIRRKLRTVGVVVETGQHKGYRLVMG